MPYLLLLSLKKQHTCRLRIHLCVFYFSLSKHKEKQYCFSLCKNGYLQGGPNEFYSWLLLFLLTLAGLRVQKPGSCLHSDPCFGGYTSLSDQQGRQKVSDPWDSSKMSAAPKFLPLRKHVRNIPHKGKNEKKNYPQEFQQVTEDLTIWEI